MRNTKLVSKVLTLDRMLTVVAMIENFHRDEVERKDYDKNLEDKGIFLV